MPFAATEVLIIGALLVGILASIELGRRLGIGRGVPKGIAAAEGAVFALLGLIIAFTFSNAATKFEGRRHLVNDEANAIGTAWLRIDLLPADAQPEIRDLFRRYLDARLEAYRLADDYPLARAKLAEAVAITNQIWAKAVAAGRRPESPQAATMLLLPALNEMFDVASTRTATTENHPPDAIFLLLGLLCLVGGLLFGYGLASNERRRWVHPLTFAIVLTLAVYVIIDLEYPRRGLIRVDAVDKILVAVRASMN